MEWKWFKEDFDKDSMMDKAALHLARKKIQANEEFGDRKKKFTMNLVEFLIWAALLVFCFSYLQSHPAEKSSLFSWTEAIIQKVKINISQWTKGHWWELAWQFQLERTFDEILNTWIMWKCLSWDEIEKIQRAVEKLKALDVQEFLKQEKAYKTVAEIYYKKVKEQCNEGA